GRRSCGDPAVGQDNSSDPRLVALVAPSRTRRCQAALRHPVLTTSAPSLGSCAPPFRGSPRAWSPRRRRTTSPAARTASSSSCLHGPSTLEGILRDAAHRGMRPKRMEQHVPAEGGEASTSADSMESVELGLPVLLTAILAREDVGTWQLLLALGLKGAD